MLTVHADGESRYRLENEHGAQVGWIRGRTIGVTGLHTERDALRAAAAGARAVQTALRRQYPGWPQHQPALEALRLVHDGAYEWVTDGRQPIARLLRLDSASPFQAPFGLEFVMPSFSSEGVAIVVAQALGWALQEHVASSGVVAFPASPAPAGAAATQPLPAA